MNAMKAANKELKGMMKTVKIEDIDVCHFEFSCCTMYGLSDFVLLPFWYSVYSSELGQLSTTL
jgi:hypothetical protein